MVKADAKSLLPAIELMSLDPSERDRRRLFWRDDMENYATMKWLPGTTEVLTYVNNEIRAFEGDYVLKILHATATRAQAWCGYMGMFPRLINAFEVRWWKNSSNDSVEFLLSIANGPLRHFCHFRLVAARTANSRWQYASAPSGAWVDVPGGAEVIENNSWNYLSIFGDFLNNRYVRLQTTGLDIDLSPLNLALFSLADTEHYGNVTVVFNQTAINLPAYSDDARIYFNI